MAAEDGPGLSPFFGELSFFATPEREPAPPPAGHGSASIATWFDRNGVHALERQHFPEYWAPGAATGPEVYQRVRNLIVDAYAANPSVPLAATAARRSLRLDAGAALKLHRFLVHWRLINASVKAEPSAAARSGGVAPVVPQPPLAAPQPSAVRFPKLEDVLGRLACVLPPPCCGHVCLPALPQPLKAEPQDEDMKAWSAERCDAPSNPPPPSWAPAAPSALAAAVAREVHAHPGASVDWAAVAAAVGARSPRDCLLAYLQSEADGEGEGEDGGSHPFPIGPLLSPTNPLSDADNTALADLVAEVARENAGIVSAATEAAEAEWARQAEAGGPRPGGRLPPPTLAAVELGVASVRARAMMGKEDAVIAQLMLDAVQCQLEKVYAKLALFDEMDELLRRQMAGDQQL